jgi:predicted GIY-YIG superfamily endonuclease
VSPEALKERRETGAVWYVYFLQLKNGDLYVGSTNDLRLRVGAHNRGRVDSTKSNLPATLRAYVGVETEAIARSLERYFKSGSGKAVAKKRFLEPA